MTVDWRWKTKGSTREHSRFRSTGPGCSSLFNMSIRSCLLNSWDISMETLLEVSERVGMVLWNRIIAAYGFRSHILHGDYD